MNLSLRHTEFASLSQSSVSAHLSKKKLEQQQEFLKYFCNLFGLVVFLKPLCTKGEYANLMGLGDCVIRSRCRSPRRHPGVRLKLQRRSRGVGHEGGSWRNSAKCVSGVIVWTTRTSFYSYSTPLHCANVNLPADNTKNPPKKISDTALGRSHDAPPPKKNAQNKKQPSFLRISSHTSSGSFYADNRL